MALNDHTGVEYGRIYDYGSEGYDGEAIERSDLFNIITRLMRDDENEKWMREARGYLAKYFPNMRMGTMMDHIIVAQKEWEKAARDFLHTVKTRRCPNGVDYGSFLRSKKDHQGPITVNDWKALFWSFTDHNIENTPLFCISEHRLPSKEADALINMVREATGGPVSYKAAPEAMRKVIDIVNKLATRTNGIYTAQAWAWLPRMQHPEVIEAQAFREECEKYQASKAGRKAKRLLLENLTPQQTEDYFDKGYFLVLPRSEKPLEDRQMYAIARGYAQGNVMRVKLRRPKGGNMSDWYPVVTFCYHTKEAHAIDDVLLAQKLILENDEQEFIKGANLLLPPGNGRYPLERIRYGI